MKPQKLKVDVVDFLIDLENLENVGHLITKDDLKTFDRDTIVLMRGQMLDMRLLIKRLQRQCEDILEATEND